MRVRLSGVSVLDNEAAFSEEDTVVMSRGSDPDGWSVTLRSTDLKCPHCEDINLLTLSHYGGSPACKSSMFKGEDLDRGKGEVRFRLRFGLSLVKQ